MKGFRKKQQDELSDSEIACGIVQHPITQCWQTWVSFHGTDVTCLTAHHKREDANNVAKQIVALLNHGMISPHAERSFKASSRKFIPQICNAQIVKAWKSGLEDQEQVSAFLKSLPSDDVPDPLPQDVVMRLSKKSH